MVLTLEIILAAGAVAALAIGPRSPKAAFGIALAALVDVALGTSLAPAVAVVVPLVAFLTAALTLAALVDQSGLAARVGTDLAAAARGSALRLYVLTCLLAACLTAIVSLDGAVVLIVPILRALPRRAAPSFAPLFLGVVVVCNCVSVAVPQGNPTNLVLIQELGISPARFIEHMVAPGLAAAAIGAVAVALASRAALGASYPATGRYATSLSTGERHAAVALLAAALAGWLAPFAGLAPWWTFVGVVAAAVLPWRGRPSLVVPWRIGAQVAGLVVTLQALGLSLPSTASERLPVLLAVALLVGGVSALINNLPVAAAAAALLGAGPAAYAASVGLAVGALATPQGSVATLIATDLAGTEAPALRVRQLAPLAIIAVVVATALLRLTL